MFALKVKKKEKFFKLFLQGLETTLDEYDLLDKPMVTEKDLQEELDMAQVKPPPAYENVEEEGQEGDDEENTNSILNVPYMHTAYSPRMGKRGGGAMQRIMKRKEKEIWQKRRFGGLSPRSSQVSKYKNLSMSKALSPFWLATTSMGARGKKAIKSEDEEEDEEEEGRGRWKKSIKRDWTRISKRGRETEGSWHPYKRDPMNR